MEPRSVQSERSIIMHVMAWHTQAMHNPAVCALLPAIAANRSMLQPVGLVRYYFGTLRRRVPEELWYMLGCTSG